MKKPKILNYNIALYIGVELLIDISTVFSGNDRHYNNTRIIVNNAKDMDIPIKEEYFDSTFENTKVFSENIMSGLAISGISIEYSK